MPMKSPSLSLSLSMNYVRDVFNLFAMSCLLICLRSSVLIVYWFDQGLDDILNVCAYVVYLW